MVVGGYGEGGDLNSVELLSLDNSVPVPDCVQMEQLPRKAQQAAGGALKAGYTFAR